MFLHWRRLFFVWRVHTFVKHLACSDGKNSIDLINRAFLILTVGFFHNMGLCLNIFSRLLARSPGAPRKNFNSKRGPQPKKFGNRWSGICIGLVCHLVCVWYLTCSLTMGWDNEYIFGCLNILSAYLIRSTSCQWGQFKLCVMNVCKVL